MPRSAILSLFGTRPGRMRGLESGPRMLVAPVDHGRGEHTTSADRHKKNRT